MTSLPAGWASASIEELAEAGGITDGPFGSNLKTEHYTEDGPRVVRLQNIGDGKFNDERAHISPHHYSRLTKHAVEAGDVLVASLGEELPRACLAPETLGSAIVKADCIRIRPHAGVLGPYVMAALNSPDVRKRVSQSIKGVGRPRVNLGDLRALHLPVAPSAEQARIVDAIDEAFSKLEAGEAGLRAVSQLIKRMREAVLAAAINGRLVAQSRDGSSASDRLVELGLNPLDRADTPPGWASVRLATIARVGSGTTPKRDRPDYWSGGSIPWVTSGLLSAGIVTSAAEFVTELALRETSLRLWPPGTLLVAMYGEGKTRGRCAELAIEASCNQACAAIDIDPRLVDYRRFLRLHFDAHYVANRRLAAGGVQPNLSGALIKAMVIALPPADEAQRIVAEVDRQFSVLDACDEAVSASATRSAALRRTVLKAAFGGKLVPQDPRDEPASRLLDRIRSERSAAPRKHRARSTA